MKRLIRSALASLSLASLSLAIPALAYAADGYVTGNVNLRAGPAPDYPLIALIPAGTEVSVQGCTDGWEWCDVIVYGNRGWVAGNYVEYEYQDRPVLLPAYGAQIGIPIVTFVIGTYWDNYYRSRPFYRERTRWYQRSVVRRPPPPPPRHPYRPPSRGSSGPGRPPVNQPHPPISHRPMPGPITPAPGLRPTPVNRPRPAAAQPGRADESRHQRVSPPAGHAVPSPSRPTRNVAAPPAGSRPSAHRPEPATGHAPSGKPDKGKTKARDPKDNQHGH
ncbi:hypothetical protein EAH75_18445 [Rhodanobacter glycinis]|uniref:SH3b domain-containing protein n=1 Tax=Rhodanobacter glycinis TaxID=582702 RepID=A0A502F871_9GAMM|nr:SH3 domain-containing protein [Rhodanobacter glycinis]TPG05412.1 hypothetical protein EAH88_15770 [Rhodanobacter glycinis]TPG45578.1 hypothetical protein EAH75_18445 [Rhodanobacter glycinis]